MYIFYNAIQNLKRNVGRNILLAAIIFAIIATVSVTLIINNTADGIIEDYQFRFGSRVNITPDTEQIMNTLAGGMGGFGGLFGGGGGGRAGLAEMVPQVTAQQSIAFAHLPYVHSYEMSAMQPGFSNIETVDGDADLEIGGGMFGGGGLGGMMGGQLGGRGAAIDGTGDVEMPNLRIYGNNWTDFDAGLRNLVDGRFPAEYGEAVISMELAEINEFALGDTFRVYSTMQIADGETRQIARVLTIVGIYFDLTPENMTGGFVRAAFLNRRNEILTSLDTVINHIGENESGVTVTATYFLHEPDMLPYFEAAARNLGLSDLMLVSTNEAEYLAIVQPVMGLRDITSTFMIIVLVLGGVVLVFIASMTIRERKYEIGVLRAMGMKKRKVALGLWTELLAITTICLVLGIGAGSLVAQPISDALLASQIENITPHDAVSNGGGMGGLFGGGGAGAMGGMMGMRGQMLGMGMGGVSIDAEPLSELDVSLGALTIMQIIGISLFLATLAGLVSITRITKYEPMKILMERN
jgi:putative ABC transport system permease protein